jgi:hypothetical protein
MDCIEGSVENNGIDIVYCILYIWNFYIQNQVEHTIRLVLHVGLFKKFACSKKSVLFPHSLGRAADNI